jgi:hypothetical protein
MEQVEQRLEDPIRHMMIPAIEAEFPLLLTMRASVLCARDHGGRFVTSDHPVHYFDRDAYKRPPLYRSPAFIYPGLEISFPVSPKQALLLTQGEQGKVEYRDVDAKVIREVNRRTRFSCDDGFLVQDGQVDPYWFDVGQRPKDSWEDRLDESVAD